MCFKLGWEQDNMYSERQVAAALTENPFETANLIVNDDIMF